MFDSAIIKLEDAIWDIDKYFQSNAQQIFDEDFIVDFAGTLEKGVDKFDEFIPGETQKSLERLLSFSSGFIIRD